MSLRGSTVQTRKIVIYSDCAISNLDLTIERIVRTRWDDMRDNRRRLRIEEIERQIARLQTELSSLID